MNASVGRREFVQQSLAATALATLSTPMLSGFPTDPEPIFRISLAEWSIHRGLQAGKLDHLDFAKIARKEFDIEAIELVNTFFKDKAENTDYLNELKTRANDHDVRMLLIMIDGEGRLGDPDAAQRKTAVENHHRWVTAAKHLGCHSIRVNAASEGSYEQQIELAVDGLRRLSEFAAEHGLNVIVENHGGLSSNGEWLAQVITQVGLKNCGTLPDFGNFDLGNGKSYDRYLGVEQLMPFAKAVSAKSHDFDDQGNETHTDYFKMLRIVVAAGYNGFVGIEYEGGKLDEFEGIRATKALLERVRKDLTTKPE